MQDRCRSAVAALAVLGLALLAAPTWAQARAESAPGTPGAQVDLNKATEDELVGVPGIGPATAKRIVEFRTQHGPFERVEDLLKVRGIGEKSIEKLRPYVKVAKGK